MSGLPGAGKKTFAQAIEARDIGYSCLPLERYLMPVPAHTTFMGWVSDFECIDSRRLQLQLGELFAGQAVTTAPGVELAEPARVADCPGVFVTPAALGFIIPGTHAFSVRHDGVETVKVYVEVSDEALASRERSRRGLRQTLGPYVDKLESLRQDADLVIRGDGMVEVQVDAFISFMDAGG